MAAAALALAAAPAAAQTPGSQEGTQTLTVAPPSSLPPAGRTHTVDQVQRAALAVPKMVRLRARTPGYTVRSFLRDNDRWQVSIYDRLGREVGQVLVDDRTGRPVEAWTGIQVAWTMARGYHGAFGRRADALYVWIPLLILFALPFARAPLRLVHLDLLALASLSISFAFFNHANIGASVPLAYPPLIYLLVRMLLIANGRGVPRIPARLRVGADFLGIAIVFLLGFRIGLQYASSNAIDVGYAGVIGADKIAHGHALYGHFPSDNPHGDTYGPVNYLVYMPFEAIWPWKGVWDDLPAAHVAATTFDFACAAGLWLLGRRLRDNTLGLLLAYLWLACPWTLLAANSDSNDGLVGVLVLGAVLLIARPAARGAMVALAGMTKFAPLALAPLFVTYGKGGRRAAGAFVLTVAVMIAFVALLDGGLKGFYDQALRFQADRRSPFSIWGYFDLRPLGTIVEVAAAVLAVVVAFFPRRRDLITVSALGAAVLIALQLGIEHWFYLYLDWFLPLLFVAIAVPNYPTARRTGSIESARPVSEQRMTTALIHGSSAAES